MTAGRQYLSSQAYGADAFNSCENDGALLHSEGGAITCLLPREAISGNRNIPRWGRVDRTQIVDSRNCT
ncbi:hypothetical protein [Luteipulveratus mongoliensis]|uniref:Uncharacterized protein n=1 Tax=Luteipulveratus mongoliensis TaxID=571913 RepID=A0A0K1JEW3_9MICO|nr:hypothetical protein [Luteipulveratus mongoliensis]AKU15236.1 hypothetical protein VV02_04120 [Luteipulveratus mongoliensis]